MKLRINIDAPEEGEPPNPFAPDAATRFESVLEEELPLLCPRLDGYAAAEVSVSFLDPAEIRDVNKQYRGLDEPTDVLTFPLWEEESLAPLNLNSAPSGLALAAAFDVLPLGDILICPEETEREHAPMTRQEALCLVLAHGFLHLLGWDHDTPEKEEAMWGRQEMLKSKLLKAIGETF